MKFVLSASDIVESVGTKLVKFQVQVAVETDFLPTHIKSFESDWTLFMLDSF